MCVYLFRRTTKKFLQHNESLENLNQGRVGYSNKKHKGLLLDSLKNKEKVTESPQAFNREKHIKMAKENSATLLLNNTQGLVKTARTHYFSVFLISYH